MAIKSVDDLNKSSLTEVEDKPAASSKATVEATPQEAEEIRAQKKKKIAQVLARGVLNDKMERIGRDATPDGWGCKLVYDDDEEVLRHQNLGFVFEYKKGAKGMMDTADGRIRIGDLLLMTINPEDRALLKEVRTERVRERIGAARQEYTRTAEEKSAKGVVAFDESDIVLRKGTGR